MVLPLNIQWKKIKNQPFSTTNLNAIWVWSTDELGNQPKDFVLHYIQSDIWKQMFTYELMIMYPGPNHSGGLLTVYTIPAKR